MTGRHVAVNSATEGHDHVAVQFRDGKEPHCPVCGLTADGRTPVSRMGRSGKRPRPPRLGDVGQQAAPGARPITGTGRGPAVDPQTRPPRGGAGGSQPGRIS